MTSIDMMLQELDQETATTRRVLERVAGDKLEWRPHSRSLTLGQLAMHVATLPGAIAEIALRNDFDVGAPIPRPGAASVDELLGALERSVATARSILAGMNDAQLATPWPMMLGDREVGAMPRGVLLRTVLFNHWYHHRGQLTVYLRETGSLVPAIYGASADESPFDQLNTRQERVA
jgi:uncharacterized damage-inducible protein DinB